MVDGIGCDVLHIDRIFKLLKYKNFLKKYFTENEIKLFNAFYTSKNNYIKKIASNFCAKEAFFKAVSSKISVFRFCDVEILRDFSGKPYVDLHNELTFIKKCFNTHITISNERDIVICVVVLEKNNLII